MRVSCFAYCKILPASLDCYWGLIEISQLISARSSLQTVKIPVKIDRDKILHNHFCNCYPRRARITYWGGGVLFVNAKYLHWTTPELSFQPHLTSISDNINEVEFHPKDYDRILAVISREGEKISVIIWLFFFLETLIDKQFYYWTYKMY